MGPLMTPLKLALALLAALALAVGLVFVLGGDPGEAGDSYEIEDAGDGGLELNPSSGDLKGNGGKGTDEGKGNPAMQPGGPDGGGGLIRRQPSGIDYSDPEVRAAELTRLMEGANVQWHEVAEIVKLMEEPFPEALRQKLLDGLTIGRRTSQVRLVFAVMRDDSFVEDLFERLDDPSVVKGKWRAVLTALSEMPAGDRDDIARKLESRLTGDERRDTEVLRAIGRRGGPEAARAIVEYVGTASNPRAIPVHILKSLDLSDKKTAAVYVQALANETKPKALQALVAAAAQPGAKTLVAPLISLDADGVPDDVRGQALDSLSRIGNTDAVQYLLRKAEEPGTFGTRAVSAVGRLNSAERGVADLLAKALDGADNHANARAYKKSVLLALGRAKASSSLGTIAKTLDDPDAEVRMAATEAMGSMGHRSRGYVNRLASQYSKGDDKAKLKVAVALGSIGGEEAVREMRRMLKQEGLTPSLKQTLLMALRRAQDDLEAARK